MEIEHIANRLLERDLFDRDSLLFRVLFEKDSGRRCWKTWKKFLVAGIGAD